MSVLDDYAIGLSAWFDFFPNFSHPYTTELLGREELIFNGQYIVKILNFELPMYSGQSIGRLRAVSIRLTHTFPRTALALIRDSEPYWMISKVRSCLTSTYCKFHILLNLWNANIYIFWKITDIILTWIPDRSRIANANSFQILRNSKPMHSILSTKMMLLQMMRSIPIPLS